MSDMSERKMYVVEVWDREANAWVWVEGNCSKRRAAEVVNLYVMNGYEARAVEETRAHTLARL